MQIDPCHASAIEPFVEEGWVADVRFEVKSGKEATVFCCTGGTRSPVPLVAAKVYRPIETRRFRNDDAYVGGRVHMAREGRLRRAVHNKSAFGRKVQYATWLAQEWEVMRRLHAAGVSVPAPLAAGERAILMPFLGDRDGAAPMLHDAGLDRVTAERVLDDLLDDVALMLDHDCVHGDLSSHNVMFHGGRAVIIDFPQAVDPRLNHNAAALLSRDLENLCVWSRKHGVDRHAGELMSRLWGRFVIGELG